MGSPKFTVGDAVFVKMRGYPAWPAKVEGIADLTPNKVKYHIFFYGTKQIAVSKEDDMFSYEKCRKVLGRPKKAKGFNEAVLLMDKELGLHKPLSSQVLDKSTNNSGTMSDNMTQNFDDYDIGNNHTLDQLLTVLQLEAQLVKINFEIQNSLNIKHANPDACLESLNDLKNIKLNKLMLKKHPEIVYTLIKLQKYVGNTSNWDLTENEIKIFKMKAREIQGKARQIYVKIEQMFQISNEFSFLHNFEEELGRFKEVTKDFSVEDIFRLTKDPTTV